MPIVTKQIYLSDDDRKWIDAKLESGAFADESEYISDLLRRDKEGRNQISDLRKAIAECLSKGMSERSLEELWAKAEKRSL